MGEVDYVAEVRRVSHQVTAIHQMMKEIMKDGEHYGVIPGTEKRDPKTGKDISKPVLYQPGADLLCMLFRFRTEYEAIRLVERDDFISMVIRCRLIHIPTGQCVGEGIGTSNSREDKYSSRTNTKTCPKCNAHTIYASKDGGWFCWRKRGGCGAEYADKDKAITDQSLVPMTDAIWNLHNTITKLGNKRAKLAAILTATAASNIFAPDDETAIEDSGSDGMTAGQWTEITELQRRIGIPTRDLLTSYITDLCGKERIQDLTSADASKIMSALRQRADGTPPATSTKPKDLKEAAVVAKTTREAKAALDAAATGLGLDTPKVSTAPSIQDLRNAVKKAGVSEADVSSWFKRGRLEEIPEAQRQEVIDQMAKFET
jgi:hypothetical protein